jgi:hypothetical protein
MAGDLDWIWTELGWMPRVPAGTPLAAAQRLVHQERTPMADEGLIVVTLELVLDHVTDAGYKLVVNEELSAEERAVASFACAIVRWLAHHYPDDLATASQCVAEEMIAGGLPEQ